MRIAPGDQTKYHQRGLYQKNIGFPVFLFLDSLLCSWPTHLNSISYQYPLITLGHLYTYYLICGGHPLQGRNTFFVCFQIFRAPPGKTLSVHFWTIAGSGFELKVTDEGTGNKTLLGSISSVYNGKTVKTGSSSVLGIDFNSKANARDPANVKMVIIIDQGEYSCQIVIIVILKIFLIINRPVSMY